MFLPIGDEPNPSDRAVVNLLLIAINIGVFLLVSLPLSSRGLDVADPEVLSYLRTLAAEMGVPQRYLFEHLSAYDFFVFQHGFRPAAPSLADLFSSMFLHSGWLHLVGNMLFLWIFGDNVELHLGHLRYLAVYLVTGVLATVFFAVFRLDSSVPLVGASGAISGVLGCYFVWFPRNRVRVLVVFIWFVNVILVPARWVLGIYLVVENLLPFLFASSSGGVAHGAHIGGFLGGAGLAVLAGRWRQSSSLWRASGWPGLRRATGPQQPRADAVQEALAAGRYGDALRDYSLMSLAERNRLRDDDVFALADWLTEERRYDAALAVLQRYIATHPQGGPALARAHLRAGLIQWRGKQRPTAAYQHLLAALENDPAAEVAAAVRDALAQIEALRRPGRTLH